MSLELSDEDKISLALIGGYTLGIALLWRMPVAKYILYPFKLVTILFHEMGHATMAVCTGGRVKSVVVDPELGGETVYTGGKTFCTLPAGYIGSAFTGALMVFCGFNLIASKVCSVIIMLGLAVSLYWAKNWLTRVLSIVFCIGIGLLWWPADGIGLKYVVLFMGVMSSMYSALDIVEDLVVRRVNESDAAKFAKLCGCCPAQGWGVIWFIFSLALMVGAVILGIYVF